MTYSDSASLRPSARAWLRSPWSSSRATAAAAAAAAATATPAPNYGESRRRPHSFCAALLLPLVAE